MRAWVGLALLLLAGCARDRPDLLEISNASQYIADVNRCSVLARHFWPRLQWGDIGDAGVTGAADNVVAGIAFTPLLVAYGAAGGAGRALATGINFFGHARINAKRHCIEALVAADGSAIVANPNE